MQQRHKSFVLRGQNKQQQGGLQNIRTLSVNENPNLTRFMIL